METLLFEILNDRKKMNIREILLLKLNELYSGSSGELINSIGKLVTPETEEIVDIFYNELMEIPDIAPILENNIVQKNLKKSLKQWILDLFKAYDSNQINELVTKQRKIGLVHANINVNLNYFNHGITILKREIYERIKKGIDDRQKFPEIFIVINELFDTLVSVISESYFSAELLHENNELSLKMKGLTQHTAIECERLRSLLLDWLRNTLTAIYQLPNDKLDTIQMLKYSNFGLWAIYKADFVSHPQNLSMELKKQIYAIDQVLLETIEHRKNEADEKFKQEINNLNEIVTKTCWYIASIVDQALEMDTGMDPLTRLFNRRYLNTILRRQTDISIKQNLPYAVLILDLDYFKKINDLHGHDNGDLVLKQFSEILLMSVRTSDFIFRYGGEEFLIVLGNAQQNEAEKIAEKIRRRCEEHKYEITDGKTIRLTCSIGIAIHQGHPDHSRVIKEADIAVYLAKEGGRNRVATQ